MQEPLITTEVADRAEQIEKLPNAFPTASVGDEVVVHLSQFLGAVKRCSGTSG